MDHSPPLAACPPEELMAEAMECRRMALNATSMGEQEALLGLAITLVTLATQRKIERH
jgi:hypothetical protein